jgi:hypothetical protein
MKHWDWSAKGVVKCLEVQNESRRVDRSIPTGNKLTEAFVSGVTSNQALFLEYLAHPDKLWLIDEDIILDNWAHDAAGKQLAGQVLTLYDRPPWRESCDKHFNSDWRDAIQRAFQRAGDARRNALAVQLLHERGFWTDDPLAAQL